jgi:hypothetical protein
VALHLYERKSPPDIGEEGKKIAIFFSIPIELTFVWFFSRIMDATRGEESTKFMKKMILFKK